MTHCLLTAQTAAAAQRGFVQKVPSTCSAAESLHALSFVFAVKLFLLNNSDEMIYCLVLFFCVGLKTSPKAETVSASDFLFAGAHVRCFHNPRTQSVIFRRLLYFKKDNSEKYLDRH